MRRRARCSCSSRTATRSLFYWLAAVVFVVGSLLDILDGALARAGGKTTPFGAFIDSTTDRMSEAFMLTAIAFVFARDDHTVFVAVTVIAVAGSFLVSYTRARAEALGLRGDVGIGSRAERVVVITAGLVLAPWGVLPWAIALLAATAWVTVVQRVLHVRKQLMEAQELMDNGNSRANGAAAAGQGPRRAHRRRQLRQLVPPGARVLQGRAPTTRSSRG